MITHINSHKKIKKFSQRKMGDCRAESIPFAAFANFAFFARNVLALNQIRNPLPLRKESEIRNQNGAEFLTKAVLHCDLEFGASLGVWSLGTWVFQNVAECRTISVLNFPPPYFRCSEFDVWCPCGSTAMFQFVQIPPNLLPCRD